MIIRICWYQKSQNWTKNKAAGQGFRWAVQARAFLPAHFWVCRNSYLITAHQQWRWSTLTCARVLLVRSTLTHVRLLLQIDASLLLAATFYSQELSWEAPSQFHAWLLNSVHLSADFSGTSASIFFFVWGMHYEYKHLEHGKKLDIKTASLNT